MNISEFWEGPNAGTLMRQAHYVRIYEKFANWADFIIKYKYGSRVIREDLNDEGKINTVIGAYMSSHEYEYTTLYNSTILEYNPIENYSMVESGDDSTTHANTVRTGSHVTTVSVAPFDSDTFSDAQQSSTPAIENGDSGTTSTHYEHSRSGNIGVTSSQQMIEQERKLAGLSMAEKLAKEIANLISIGIYD